MARKFTDKKLVLASHNNGKLVEIRELLAPFDIQVVSAGELGLPEPEETGTTFAENATIKAVAATKATGLPALSDDSGLAVNALDGQPGIYSARWAGPGKDFAVAMDKVNNLLNEKNATDRSGYFICCMALAWPDGHVETLEGTVHGELVWPPRGDKGFGFDPMFVPKGHNVSFAEMDSDKKQDMSHRANAFKKLIKACFNG